MKTGRGAAYISQKLPKRGIYFSDSLSTEAIYVALDYLHGVVSRNSPHDLIHVRLLERYQRSATAYGGGGIIVFGAVSLSLVVDIEGEGGTDHDSQAHAFSEGCFSRATAGGGAAFPAFR